MTCEHCEDTGEISIPAHVEAGQIVDEQLLECVCTLSTEYANKK